MNCWHTIDNSDDPMWARHRWPTPWRNSAGLSIPALRASIVSIRSTTDIPVGTSSRVCSAGSVDRLNNWLGASAATQLSSHDCGLQPSIVLRSMLSSASPVSTSVFLATPATPPPPDQGPLRLQLLTAAPSNDRGTDRMTDVHKTANIKHRRAQCCALVTSNR